MLFTKVIRIEITVILLKKGVSYDEPFKCTNVAAKYLTEAQVQQILDFHNDKRRYVASGKERRGDKGPQPPAFKMGAIPDLVSE